MQFITTDQRIAVENFEIGLIYTVTFTSGSYFLGACIGIGKDYVMFQRTAPELIFSLTMAAAADVASIEPLGDDIGKILEYTGTVPTTIKTDGSPLLDYLITGKTVQNGTPTPDNPIMPEGTGERTGNLLFKKIANGGINPSGKVVETTTYDLFVAKVTAGDIVTVSNFAEAYAFYGSEPATGSISIDNTRYITYDTPYTITIPNGAEYIAVRAYNTQDNTMLNVGKTALPYEPYGYKIPISSAGQTTPVYLGEVQTTRKIKKYEFTGTESIGTNGLGVSHVGFTFLKSDILSTGRTKGFCSHFVPQYSPNGSALDGITFGANDSVIYVTFSVQSASDYNLTDTTSIKAWLAQQYAAGTPVTVWYVLANEETAVVNEPLMRIGDYADTLSYRQSGINIPTTDGLNIFDIDTTVKPSEVYLKYFSPLL